MRFLLIIIISALSFPLVAQLQTSGGMSPAQLVQNVLVGQGVQISNIHFSGASQAIGTFNSLNANVGIDEGIILTTGTIYSNSQGPRGPNNSDRAGMDNGTSGYSQLSNIVGTKTFNATLLEFDFIPYSDTVRFKYVFASEEYPEWVGSDYNDVFAFFISGPGISGMKNMAIIPGSSQSVAINNVNQNSNSSHYQYNGTGSNSPYNSSSYYIQYDGFTKPLEAVSKVQCGKKYHLVIAIADASDPIYDSGIFLEKNSLESIQPIQVSYHLLSDPYGDGQTMSQNCTSAIVKITRSGNVNQPLDIPITVLGDAIEGLDYSSIPSVIHFAPGQTVVTFIIHALNNAALTGKVTILLKFKITNPCGEIKYQTVELFIKPVEPVTITVNDITKDCPDEEVELIAKAAGGGGKYTYSWSTGETTPSITVNPTSTTTYSVSVTDECLQQTATDQATVTVPVLTPLLIDATDDIVEQCPYMPNNLAVEATGGSGNYTYQWKNENGRLLGIDSKIQVSPYSTTTYKVYVKEECGEMDSAIVKVTILSPPLLLDISPQQIICPSDSAKLTVTATGGYGNYYYFWPHSEETTSSVWVNPDSTRSFSVIVRDDCQTFQVEASTKVVVVQPKANFRPITSPKFVGLPITFQNLSKDAVNYTWDFGNGANSTMVHPNNTYYSSGVYNITLIAKDRYGCLDTIVKPIKILKEFYLYVPNTFTPDGNRSNNTFSVSAIGVKEFNIQIYNRWGELLFHSDDVNFKWDGIFAGELVQDGTYIWKIEYKSIHDKEMQIKVGHVNVLR